MTYLWRRIGAYFIDMSICVMFIKFVTGLLGTLIGPMFSLTFTSLSHDMINIILYIILEIVICLGYSVLSFKFFSYPLGKLLMSLKVYDSEGNRPTTKQYAKREFYKLYLIFATSLVTLFAYTSIYSFWQFGFNVSRDRLTFHDRLSNTKVDF